LSRRVAARHESLSTLASQAQIGVSLFNQFEIRKPAAVQQAKHAPPSVALVAHVTASGGVTVAQVQFPWLMKPLTVKLCALQQSAQASVDVELLLPAMVAHAAMSAPAPG